MRYTTRPTGDDDIQEIFSLDCKCNWNPYQKSMWERVIVNYWVNHICFGRDFVGCIVGTAMNKTKEGRPGHDCFRIMKCFVHPNFRRKGISKYLLSYASQKASQYGTINKLDMIVPESQTHSGCKFKCWYIGPWLIAMKWKATGIHDRKLYKFPGSFDDGIRFERPLVEENEYKKN